LFLCDEYHAFATVGENDPSGDEKFFALSRQAKCIPIVATQSLSSLRSTLPRPTIERTVCGLHVPERDQCRITFTNDPRITEADERDKEINADPVANRTTLGTPATIHARILVTVHKEHDAWR
jgi:hypothetical protein